MNSINLIKKWYEVNIELFMVQIVITVVWLPTWFFYRDIIPGGDLLMGLYLTYLAFSIPLTALLFLILSIVHFFKNSGFGEDSYAPLKDVLIYSPFSLAFNLLIVYLLIGSNIVNLLEVFVIIHLVLFSIVIFLKFIITFFRKND